MIPAAWIVLDRDLGRRYLPDARSTERSRRELAWMVIRNRRSGGLWRRKPYRMVARHLSGPRVVYAAAATFGPNIAA